VSAVDEDEHAGREQLARSSVAVAIGTLLSRLTGLARVGFLAWALGAASLADTYNFANTTPNILYELLLGGILTATLVPVFVSSIKDRDEHAISAVFTTALTAITAFTVLTMVCAPFVARLLAIRSSDNARLHAAQVHVFVIFLLCFMPQMIFYGFTALASALLNAKRRFVAAAFAPVVNNLIVIAMLTVFAIRTTHDRARWIDVTRVRNDSRLLLLLGAGTTAGIVAMAAVLVPALRRARVRLRPVFAWRDPAVRTMLRLSGWTVGYVIANEIAQLFVLVLANAQTGNVSSYFYAFTFYQVPQGLLAVSIMTTMMPELARRVANNDTPGLRRDFDLGLRYLIVLMLPASVLFACLAQPMIGVLRIGGFGMHSATTTADVLQAFAISSVFLALYLYTLRGFYALHDTRTPFVINCFENACNIVFAVALYPSLGVQGLALAWSAAYVLASILAIVVLRRRVGEVPGRSVVTASAKAALGAAALAIVAVPLAGAIGRSSAAHALLATAAAGGLGIIVYVVVLAVTRSDELRSLVDLVRRRGVRPADVSP
jgi:putative peptidoglycan lipid II flippase